MPYQIRLVVLGTLLSSSSAQGQISLSLTANIQTKVKTLNVQIVVSNVGREEAHQIQPWIREAGETMTLPGKNVLLPGARYESEAELSIEQKIPGKYPLFVVVGYTDRNGYPFSAVHCVTFFLRQDTVSDIFGVLRTEPVSDSAPSELSLKNLSSQDRKLNITIFTPKELSAVDYLRQTTLAPAAEQKFRVMVRNFSALPGSSYPVYAVVEYDDKGRHFTAVLPAQIAIVAQGSLFRKYRTWLLLTAAGFVFAGVLLSVIRKRKNRAERSRPT